MCRWMRLLQFAGMEVISEESDNLVGKTRYSLKERQRNRQRREQRAFGSGCCKMAWVATMAMLIFVSLYLAVQVQELSKCNAQKQELSAQATPVQTQESASSEEQAVETIPIPKNEIYSTTLQELTNPNEPTKEANHESSQIDRPTTDHQASKNYHSSYNLWTMSREEKIELLAQIQQEENLSKLNYTPFLSSKDQETEEFFLDYENRSMEIDWRTMVIPKQLDHRLQERIRLEQEERQQKFKTLVDKYKAKYQKKTGYLGQNNKGITYSQFFRSLEWKKMTAAQVLSSDEDIKQLQQQQRKFYQDKYDISSYEELPLCIIMPTYNNKQNLRYVWSIESVLQQEYSNLKVIIIDDASKDKTAESTAAYLKWRRADPEKYIVIAAKQHRTALENIYYGVHKYCDYGQIFMIVDGDDQLIGRQAFKVVNALYQKEKMYVLYSQFISYDPKTRKEVLDIGISQDFPSFVKRQNSYRTFKHSYSQLRSMISDLILLERMSSLKLKSGRFFEILYDNAIFYPAFEMACQNIYYLPEIFYWYNMNTGVNDWYKAKTAFYKENRFGIELQKQYRCIEEELRKVKEGQ